MAFRKILSWLKSQYDKVIAFLALLVLLVSLLYLAVRVGMIPIMQKQFDKEIVDIHPDREAATAVDISIFDQILGNIHGPFHLPHEEWTNAMFVPERRVWCVDCRRPIPVDAEICPFCNVKQPEDKEVRAGYDGDKDGIWDQWERKYNLDPFDPDDAKMDSDGDGFSNLEEFISDPKTDPTNRDDYPPVVVKLSLEKVVADPFKLRFKSVIKLPDDSLQFAINTRGDVRTYFVTMGQEVEGFKVVKYEEKFEENILQGRKTPQAVDVSELTLQRGDRLIVLVKGKNIQYDEYIAHLFFSLDGSEHVAKIGDVLTLKEKKYEVISIDSKPDRILIHNMQDGKETIIEKFSRE